MWALPAGCHLHPICTADRVPHSHSKGGRQLGMLLLNCLQPSKEPYDPTGYGRVMVAWERAAGGLGVSPGWWRHQGCQNGDSLPHFCFCRELTGPGFTSDPPVYPWEEEPAENGVQGSGCQCHRQLMEPKPFSLYPTYIVGPRSVRGVRWGLKMEKGDTEGGTAMWVPEVVPSPLLGLLRPVRGTG